MGIQVEFNPALALRKHGTKGRLEEECLPKELKKGIYPFLKKGQRIYWLQGEIPLLETRGNQQISRPLASIKIIEATHFIKNNEPYTKGGYKIIDKFDENDPKINFEYMTRIK